MGSRVSPCPAKACKSSVLSGGVLARRKAEPPRLEPLQGGWGILDDWEYLISFENTSTGRTKQWLIYEL